MAVMHQKRTCDMQQGRGDREGGIGGRSGLVTRALPSDASRS